MNRKFYFEICAPNCKKCNALILTGSRVQRNREVLYSFSSFVVSGSIKSPAVCTCGLNLKMSAKAMNRHFKSTTRKLNISHLYIVNIISKISCTRTIHFKRPAICFWNMFVSQEIKLRENQPVNDHYMLW